MSNQKNKSKDESKNQTTPAETIDNTQVNAENKKPATANENTGAIQEENKLDIEAVAKNIKKQVYLIAHSLHELAEKANKSAVSIKKVVLQYGMFHAICEELDEFNKENTFVKSVQKASVHECIEYINRRSGMIEEMIVLDGNRAQFIVRFLAEAYEKAEKEVEAEEKARISAEEKAKKKAQIAEIEAKEKELAEQKKQLK